jgi:hypothetical protein
MLYIYKLKFINVLQAEINPENFQWLISYLTKTPHRNYKDQ